MVFNFSMDIVMYGLEFFQLLNIVTLTESLHLHLFTDRNISLKKLLSVIFNLLIIKLLINLPTYK